MRILRIMLTISEILEKCGQLKIAEERASSRGYCEQIIFADEIDQWIKALTDILGSAVKPAGQKATPQYFSKTVDYGGILDNQTLFYKKFEDKSILAMLWPWKNKIHVTLKIVCFQE